MSRHHDIPLHGYDQVDYDVLWRIVTVELPPLIHHLETMLAGHLEGAP